MSGVGSTNAMKKGSANNPFLAYSEADMQGFLNSAYTGCIVKYSGESISRYLAEQNKTVAEYAQNLVFNTAITYYPFVNGYVRIKIQKVTSSGTETSYITAGVYNNGTWYFEKNTTGHGTPVPVLTNSLETGTTNVKYLKDIINDQGNITEWLYDEDVTFTVEAGDYGQTAGYVDYSKTHDITIVPYKVNELYKVVYGDGEYYYEEFYHISDTRTTANSDYMAPGKTAFDFTGNLQTGNGSKINPYLAYTVAELQAYPVGSFIKWLGPNKTILDATTGQMLIQGEVYRAVEDGDIL